MTALGPVHRDGAQRARAALKVYSAQAASVDQSLQELLRSLILDLGQIALAEGVPFMPVIAHAQAWWLRENAQAKERPKAPS